MIIEKVKHDIPDQIKFKNSMLKTSFSDYEDAYILPKRTIATTGAAHWTARHANGRKIDNAKHFDIVMSMHNKIKR